MKLHVTRYIAGSPLQAKENIALTRDHLPKALGPVKDWVRRGDAKHLRATLTLLAISRCARGGWKSPDLAPIVEESTCSIQIPESFIRRFTTDFKIRACSDWVKPHWSTKAGPHGPAIWTSLRDLKVLPDDLIKDIGTLGGVNLRDYINTIQQIPGGIFEELKCLFEPKGRVSPFRRLNVK